MAAYADHPDAARLYKLALRASRNWRSPKLPARTRVPATTTEAKARKIKGRKLSRANRSRCATTNVISIGCFGAATPLRRNEPYSLET